MGRANLAFCDLCKSEIELNEENYTVTVKKGRSVSGKGDLCSICAHSIIDKIEEPFNILPKTKTISNNSAYVQSEPELIKNINKTISDSKTQNEELKSNEIHRVPSIAHKMPRQKPKCPHDKTSFTDDGVICLQCSEKLSYE